MAEPSEVHVEAEGVVRIDHGWQMPRMIASYLVVDGDEAALVEAGPASTLDALLAGIRAAGVDPADVTTILPTHVHLDHAAGAGALLRHMPRARVGVHPLGAAHLADPSRLLASATRIYGDRMDELWGTMLPVPADRLDVLADGAAVRVGRRTLVAVDTPGHARHHLAFHDADAGLVFTGDVAGIRLPGSPFVLPPTPPPEFEPERWHHSIARLRALRPATLLPTHFGAAHDPERHLDELAARVADWTAWATARVAAGDDVAALARGLAEKSACEIAAATGDPPMAARYEAAVGYPMLASGLHRAVTRG
jgi:glyoxylase-like metal-dependent hydrolase (beta-lactamase superfamily II)